MSDLDDILAHYGIKGMRWGVRRSRAELDRAAGRRVAKGKPVTKTKASADAIRAAQLKKTAKKQGTKVLSNNELKELNTRIQLEQQYKNLNKGKKLSKEQQKMIADIVGAGAGVIAANVINTPRTKSVGRAIVLSGNSRTRPSGPTPSVEVLETRRN